MFTGIDEVDWASLRHAYGSAGDVPGLLRGLASADPVERWRALDGMYGAVHHQGEVYDSTLACVPFLFALAVREEVRDRGGIVELLVSIGGEGDSTGGGGAGIGGEGESVGDGGAGIGGDGDNTGGGGAGIDRADVAADPRGLLVVGPRCLATRARAAVRAGAERFSGLAGDADPAVRGAAAGALVRFLDDPARVLALVRQRITVERNDQVLFALAESLGLFARRYPGQAAEAVRLLVTLSGPPYGPGLRLAALGQLAACAPERLPADLTATVVGLLRDRSGQRACEPTGPDRPAGDTLAGRLRRLRPVDDEGSRLLRTLHAGLGGRAADRIALLRGQLGLPDPVDRCTAVWISSALFREWRGDHTGPITLVGDQLDAEEDWLRDAAASVLADLFAVAAPAADRLHALVTHRPEARVRHWERGAPTLGAALKALARTGDPRAAPVLAEVLASPVVPDDLGHVVPHLGRAAAPLAPALRRRLAAVPADSPGTHARAVPLLSALAALGDTESVPEVLRLLRGMPVGLRRRDAVVAAAVRALGAFGPAAHEAIPVLRGLLATEWAVVAADALWSVEGDADAVVPALVRELEGEGHGQRAAGEHRHRRAAAESLARLGPAARPALPGLRGMTGSADVWERTAAACAVWRTTGEPDPALTVLRAAWTGHAPTRGPIAACVASLGPAGAPLHDLLRTELAAPRRHRAGSCGYGSHDVDEDERLLRVCREGLSVGG